MLAVCDAQNHLSHILRIDPGNGNGFCFVCEVFWVILAVPRVVGCDGVRPGQIANFLVGDWKGSGDMGLS